MILIININLFLEARLELLIIVILIKTLWFLIVDWSELINRGATKWSVKVTNYVTRSDQHDRQYCVWGDDDRRDATMVWLGSLKS